MWVLVIELLVFLSAVFPRVPLVVLDHTGRLGGNVGSACEEFEDNDGSILS